MKWVLLFLLFSESSHGIQWIDPIEKSASLEVGLSFVRQIQKCMQGKGSEEMLIKNCSEQYLSADASELEKARFLVFLTQDIKWGHPTECDNKALKLLPVDVRRKVYEGLCFQDISKKRQRELMILLSQESEKLKLFKIRH